MTQSDQRHADFARPGAPPGTILATHETPTAIHVFGYGPETVSEFDCRSFTEAKAHEEDYEVVWIDVTGLGDIELLKDFAEQFNIHSLNLEDVVNVHQRAKFESFDDYNYLVTRMVYYEESLESEQLSIFQSGKFIITFQERMGDCLEPLRARIRHARGNVRCRKSDYLLYALFDTVIDHYFPVTDRMGDQLDEQDKVLMSGGEFLPQRIREIRGDLLHIRRWLRPNREALNQIVRDDSPQITDETRIFMRDCYDHLMHLQETVESYREICSDLRDYHQTVVSNRINDVMKTLTIVSTIFIPLGFIAGLYGMNFEIMPELKWRYGYFATLGLMGTIAVSFFCWFKYRGWF
jgi:magnesium transporter